MTDKNSIAQEAIKVRKATLSYQFNRFSLILYLVISVICIGAFVLSSYNVGMANIERIVSFAAESANLRLAETMNSELGYIIKLSNSYAVQDYFNDPEDEVKRNRAFEEFEFYRTSFLAEKDVFWINDAERIFYSTYSDPYSLDPSMPENYWYNFTLYDTEYYNFNVNYNPDLQSTKLWINAPVFQKTTFGETTIPTGMLGAGVDLTEFSTALFSELDPTVEVFIFNREGEVTVSENTDYVVDKIKIQSLFDNTGKTIFDISQTLSSGDADMYNFESNGRFYSVNYITSMDWFVCAFSPITAANTFDNSTTIVFVLMYIALLLAYMMMFFFVRHISKILAMRQEELLQSKIEAETANKAKSDFLAVMSHEIRTPLNAIIGVAQILLSDDIQDKYRESIEKINNSGKSLLAIINDILDLSKIESGKLEIHPDVFDTPSLIYDTVMLNVVRIGNKPIEMQLEVDEQLPQKLFGDELRIKQVMNNLLSNAFKYTEKGRVCLAISGQNAGDFYALTLSVSDTGQGMHQGDLDRLFTEYSRFNSANNRLTEGTGLGLNITKRLVTMMNGDINVKSVFGEGSEFTVVLRLRVSDTEAIGKEAKERLEQFRFIKQTNEMVGKVLIKPMPYGSVLVVDDVATNLYVAEGLLKPYGVKISTASSGFAAIDIIKSGETFDIIFMDHMMPDMDGIETVKKIREIGYTLPIAALTANAIVGNEAIFKESGFDDFLSKPIDIRDLNRILVKFVRDRHPEQAKIQQQSPSAQIAVETAQKINPKLLEVFIKDVKKAVVSLPEQFRSGDLKSLAITAHGMKSAAANAGEKEVSETAKSIEFAAKDNDAGIISENLPKLIAMLRALIDKFDRKQEKNPANESATSIPENLQKELLTNAAHFCAEYDESGVNKIFVKMREYELSDELAAFLENIENLLLHAEFEAAETEIDRRLKSFEGMSGDY